MSYARGIVDNGFPPGVVMIDDTWQTDYGVWRFDAAAFDDPKGMMDALHKMGFKVSLWICPFVSMDSRPYRAIAPKGDFVLREGDRILLDRSRDTGKRHDNDGS